MKSKKEVLNSLAEIIQLDNQQKEILLKQKFHKILNADIIKDLLNLNKQQKNLYDNLFLFHRNLEKVYSSEQLQTIYTPEDALNIIAPYMSSLNVEEMVAVYLNNNREILDIKVIGKGHESMVPISPTSVFKFALILNASGVLLAHNHPGGSSRFSKEDYNITELIEKTGNYLNITLIDHLIYTKQGIISYAEEDIIKKI
jgi:DNA repair protein RadC